MSDASVVELQRFDGKHTNAAWNEWRRRQVQLEHAMPIDVVGCSIGDGVLEKHLWRGNVARVSGSLDEHDEQQQRQSHTLYTGFCSRFDTAQPGKPDKAWKSSREVVACIEASVCV